MDNVILYSHQSPLFLIEIEWTNIQIPDMRMLKVLHPPIAYLISEGQVWYSPFAKIKYDKGWFKNTYAIVYIYLYM